MPWAASYSDCSSERRRASTLRTGRSKRTLRAAISRRATTGSLFFWFSTSERLPFMSCRVRPVASSTRAKRLSGDRTVCAPVLDVYAVDEHAMDGAIALDERGRVGSRELAIRVVDGVGAEAGVQAGEGRSQTALEYHVAKAGVASFGCGFTDFHGWAVKYGVAQFVEPFEGGFFDDGFGE